MEYPKAWPAPAKLNLFLHITGQRDDGYHLLQTVFIFLEHCDRLSFEVNESGIISCDYQLNGVDPEKDIIYLAARALQSHSGVKLGVTISLDKVLPMGGGLGGGSSDAATTLLALNQLWGCKLDLAGLKEIGLSLGADVPVFIQGQACWAEGVGDEIRPIDLPESWFVVLIPKISVSTAKVFANPQLIRNCPAITIRDFLAGLGQNVCEPVVAKLYPEVQAALSALGQFAKARMTGTGACVFAEFDSEEQANQAWSALSDQWDGFVAQGLNRSPVLGLLDQS
ncbi:MAG: 4-(cytidine 5'-diphospho)-2-C-methyl-D-erythritol kinase [Thioalkalispiraceae bacterium]|jgi:4-diphosphocytidyl-2-C-methyl-D-erythritol kinase